VGRAAYTNEPDGLWCGGAHVRRMTLMIDLAEWEADLASLQVTRAPHRMGGRVIWIAARPSEPSAADEPVVAVIAVEPVTDLVA
jgi:hypothetical protein